MKRPLAVAISCLLASSVSYAAVSVNENTISWPNDGWYQVQSATTYDEVCRGVRSCVVDPGTYIVINHTTGERFENVQVGLSNDPASPIVVTGNTITWPDDGWYQVQTIDDYSNVCNGGSSCTVPDGTYTVINHTKGKRYSNVLVSSDDAAASGGGLETLGDSRAFYTALKEALINRNGADGYRGDVFFSDEDILPSAPVLDAPVQDSAGVGNAVAGEANDVTTTNVQEVGVDEQDRVKINAAGTRLFVLNNNFPYYGPGDFLIDEPIFIDEPLPVRVQPDLVVLEEPDELPEAWPEDLPIDAPLEVAPVSPVMLQPSTSLRILALDAETPDATSIIDFPVDLNGRTADGLYLYENDDQSSAIVTASGGGYWGYWGSPEAFSGLQSIIAKVDVSDAPNPSLTDSFTIDGQIISSRRIGDSLFFASRYYPAIPGLQPWAQTADEWREAVEAANLTELMPEISRNGSNDSTPLVDASACFVAPRSGDQPYYSPDIITLGVIDLATMRLRDSECFLGATETLYANTKSVFVATTQYNYSLGPVTVEGEAVDTDVDIFAPDMVWFDPRTTTDIHQFDIDSDQLSYAGSGSVRGHLGWNLLQKPYRMSEADGYLRVATMNDQQGPDHSPILLSILKSDGGGNLETVSSLPNQANPQHIGKPGEQLYASRFLGDRAYLVTFRQTDPLYVVDLADPANPQVKGELEIEGYSDYLLPVGEGLLLGIGKDAVAAEDGFGDGRGAWVQGMKLSLFDVSDPATPTEVKSVLLGERGTNSVALSNPRAITIQPANDLHPMRVSFGADVYGEASPVSSPSPEDARGYSTWSYTGLHGYDITVGANANIIPRGALIIARGDEYSWPSYGDDRAVMVNDAVFYVNGRSVYPALWDNLGLTPDPR